MSSPDYYQILGVEPNASEAEIRTRYRFLARAYHPDRFSDSESKEQANRELQRINEAHSILSDPDKRAQYDNERRFTNQQSEDVESNEKTTEYLKELSQYFDQLMERWKYVIDQPVKNQEFDQASDKIIEQFVIVLKSLYYSPEHPSAKQNIDEINKSLLVMVYSNMALGVEIVKNGLPNKYKQIELQIFTCIPLYQKMSSLILLASQRNALPTSYLDQIMGKLAELSLQYCEICSNIGQVLITNLQSSTKREEEPISRSNSAKAGNTAQQANQRQFCQSCGRITPAENLIFRQNIGAVFLRFVKTYQGNFCAACAEKYFWRTTGISLLFGWWGVISFFVTPFIILANIGNYLRAWSIRRYSNGLFEIELGWKLAVSCVLGLAIWAASSLFSGNALSENTPPSASFIQPTTIPVVQKQPTLIPTRRAVPTIYNSLPQNSPTDGCVLWSKVTASDKGRQMCVYGTVNDAYFTSDQKIFYIIFSSNANAFRMLKVDGRYYKDIIGNCVKARGEVKTYVEMPYIEISEKLYHCQ